MRTFVSYSSAVQKYRVAHLKNATMRLGILAVAGVALLFIGLSPQPSQAALIITMTEGAGDVVGNMSGSLNLAGLSNNSSFNDMPSSATNNGSLLTRLRLGAAINQQIWSYPGATGTSDWRVAPLPFSEIQATAGSGGIAGIEVSATNVFIGVPGGYSGGPLTSTSTWAGQTFASLNMAPGSYVYTWPGDTLTVNIGPVIIPEPSAIALLLGTGACVFVRRRL